MMSLGESLHQSAELALKKGIASSISIGVRSFGGVDEQVHLGLTSEHPLVVTDKHTIYDLASLTKILGTTLSYARVFSEGRASLNDKPFSCWPKVTIKALLGHTSGLWAHRHFYEDPSVRNASTFEQKRKAVYKQLFEETPSLDTRTYSDSGYIALGYYLEQIYKKPLKDIFDDSLKKAGITSNFQSFPSSTHETFGHLDIAPTGFCSYRKMLLRATVNDLNCFVLGGLHGHAGLFGRLEDVMQYGSFVLNCLTSPQSPLEEELAHLAKNRLGFDHPHKKGSNRFFSPSTVGHFGYTGTSLWIDPKRKLVVSVLTNRVHKSIEPQGIYWLRESVHRQVATYISPL